MLLTIRFIRIALLPILISAPLWAQNQWIDQGIKALDEQRYQDAVELFSKAVAANPDSIDGHFNLALANSLLGNDAAAIPEYRTVLQKDPNLFEAQINLGQTLLRAHDAAAAIPILQKAGAQRPADYRPHYFLGEALLETQAFADAETAYRKAIAIEPENVAAQFGLGRALAHQGKLEEADPLYRKAAAADPQLHSFLLELGQIYEDREQFDKAIAIFQEFPDDPAAQEHLGLLSLRTGSSAQATAALERAVAAAPSVPNRLALAQAYVEQKQLDKAEPIAAQLSEGAPQDFRIRMFYGRILRDERKFSDAALQFQTAATIDASSPEAWGELAGVQLMAEQYPQAIDAYAKVEALGAAKPGHYFFRATAHDRLRQKKEAMDYYNRFLVLDNGANPDQEFQARQRIKLLEP